jgi:uncharacterized protein YuzE
MRITFDRAANAAYIYLIPMEPGAAVKTEGIAPPHIKGMFNLDFNKNGRLIGIEILGATQVLPSEVLEQAERL